MFGKSFSPYLYTEDISRGCSFSESIPWYPTSACSTQNTPIYCYRRRDTNQGKTGSRVSCRNESVSRTRSHRIIDVQVSVQSYTFHRLHHRHSEGKSLIQFLFGPRLGPSMISESVVRGWESRDRRTSQFIIHLFLTYIMYILLRMTTDYVL